MRRNSESFVRHVDEVGKRSPGTTRLPKILGATLFLFLLHNPIQTRGSVLGPYSVTLGWNASPDPAVSGYRVYYGTSSGNYSFSADVGSATIEVIPGLASGGSYFFAVTAYNAVGVESTFSDEVSFVAGQPNLQISVTPHGPATLTVNGTLGHTYNIQASQDLVNWTVIGTVTVGATGPMSFTDPNAGSFSNRFYRTHDTQM